MVPTAGNGKMVTKMLGQPPRSSPPGEVFFFFFLAFSLFSFERFDIKDPMLQIWFRIQILSAALKMAKAKRKELKWFGWGPPKVGAKWKISSVGPTVEITNRQRIQSSGQPRTDRRVFGKIPI